MDAKLLNVIQKMLLEDWDPIGVNEFSNALDEYDGYVAEITALVCSRASEQEMFKQLWTLETGHMGLDGDANNTRQFAEKLYALSRQRANS